MDVAYLLLPILGAFVLLFISCCCAHRVKNIMQVHEGLSYHRAAHGHRSRQSSHAHNRTDAPCEAHSFCSQIGGDLEPDEERAAEEGHTSPMMGGADPQNNNNINKDMAAKCQSDASQQNSDVFIPHIVCKPKKLSDGDSGMGDTPSPVDSDSSFEDIAVQSGRTIHGRARREFTVVEVHAPQPKPPSPPP